YQENSTSYNRLYNLHTTSFHTDTYAKVYKKINSSFFFSSRRRHTRFSRDWSSDVFSSDLSLESAVHLYRQPAGHHPEAIAGPYGRDPPVGLHRRRETGHRQTLPGTSFAQTGGSAEKTTEHHRCCHSPGD